jgi:hypothetical protein
MKKDTVPLPLETTPGEKTPPALEFDLRLRTLKSSKNTFARLMRERARGTIDDGLFRSLIWAMSIFIGYLRLDAEQGLEDRLRAIEDLLQRRKPDEK